MVDIMNHGKRVNKIRIGQLLLACTMLVVFSSKALSKKLPWVLDNHVSTIQNNHKIVISTQDQPVALQHRNIQTANTPNKSKPSNLDKSNNSIKKIRGNKSPTLLKQPAQVVPDTMTWNLHNADIKSVVQQVSKFTGKNFILGDNVRGNITLISDKPIRRAQLYNVFLSALQVIGLTVIPDGEVIKIVQQTDMAVKGLNYPLLSQSKNSSADQVAIEVIEVVNVPAVTIAPMLRPLMTSSMSQLIAVTGTNYIIAVDTVQALGRLKELIKRIDVSSANIDIMPLHNALASEVVNVLNQLLNTSNATVAYGASKVAVAADDRSNSILLSGDKGQRLRLRLIIANLDQKTQGQGNIATVYLKYQKAEDVVQVLQNVVQSYYNQMQGKQDSKVSSSVQNVNSSNLQGSNANSSSMYQDQGSSSSGSSGDFGDLQTLSNSLVEKPRQVEGVVIGNTSITSEPTLNALIISAPPTLMRIIRQIITQLDVRRRQILVEAIIARVDDDFSRTLGIQWLAKPGSGRIGFGSGNDINIFNDNPTISTLAGGSIGGFAAGIFSGHLDVLLSMLENTKKATILSTPSLVTLDNVKAQIFSGQSVPIETSAQSTPSSYQPPVGAPNPNKGLTITKTYERQAVGTTLALIPQITVSNAVQLQLVVANTNITAAALLNSSQGGGPNIDNQNIKTTVLVNNGDILVLGGLKGKNATKQQDRVPFLSDIPLIGEAFKYNETAMKEQNLMIFIRPVIIDNPQKSLMISQNKYEFMQDKFLLSQVKAYHAAQQALMMPSLRSKKHLILPNPFLFNSSDDRRYQEQAYRHKG